jgi:preprotein translocase subunit YajC
MDQPTQQLPPPQPPRRRRTLLLSGVFSALLVAGVLTAGLVVAGVAANRPQAQASESLDTLFQPVAAEDQRAGAADRPGRHWRRHHGPLRLAEGEKVVAGSVTSVADGKLTVRKDNGAEITVPTDGDTKVRGNGNKALSDLQPGERVVVKAGSDGTADAVLAVRAHANGTVTKLEGDRATVVSPGGLTRELDLSGVQERPAVGTVVIAVGTATEDGATLKVEEIKELPTLG